MRRTTRSKMVEVTLVFSGLRWPTRNRAYDYLNSLCVCSRAMTMLVDAVRRGRGHVDMAVIIARARLDAQSMSTPVGEVLRPSNFTARRLVAGAAPEATRKYGQPRFTSTPPNGCFFSRRRCCSPARFGHERDHRLPLDEPARAAGVLRRPPSPCRWCGRPNIAPHRAASVLRL